MNHGVRQITRFTKVRNHSLETKYVKPHSNSTDILYMGLCGVLQEKLDKLWTFGQTGCEVLHASPKV